MNRVTLKIDHRKFFSLSFLRYVITQRFVKIKPLQKMTTVSDFSSKEMKETIPKKSLENTTVVCLTMGRRSQQDSGDIPSS